MDLTLLETRLSDAVFTYTFGGDDAAHAYGANATVVLGDGDVLVVDPFISPVHAALLEERVAARSRAPGRVVVVTHHHTDHALGAAWYQRRGARVLAHEACRERARAEHPGLIASRRADPELAPYFREAEPLLEPLLTVRSGARLRVSGLEVRVRHLGPAHTPGDVVVHVPALGLVVCGDLVSSGYHTNLEDADVAGFRRALRALRELGEAGATTFVPGHGPSGGLEVVEAQEAYLDEVEAIVRRSQAAGLPGPAIEAAVAARFPLYRLGIAVSTFASAFG